MLAFLKKGKKEEKTSDSGAGQKKDKSAQADAIPDELPTLTQDVLNEAIPDEAAVDEDIPDELPSLELNGETLSEPEVEPKSAPEESVVDDVPEELEPLEVEIKPASSEPAKPAVQSKPVIASEPAKPLQPVSEEGYFSDIEDRLKHGENPQSVLSGMKEHWKKEHKVEEELKPATQTELEGEIRDITLELQELESKWVEHSNSLERTKNFILSMEAEISIKSEELKNLLEKLDKVEKIYEKVKEQPV